MRLQSNESPRKRAIRWAGRIAIASLMLAAGATHYLRDIRERQLEDARAFASKGNYREAFQALDLAEGWPSCAKPGRIDYLRAEAYTGIGDRARAELLYLRSLRDDPTYYWAVADLAKLYASPEGRSGKRGSLAAYYMDLLASDFPNHPDLNETLASIKRRLAEPVRSSGKSDR